MRSLVEVWRSIKKGLPDALEEALLRGDLPSDVDSPLRKMSTTISIKPFNSEVYPQQDGAHIDLGLRMIVEGHDQPFELSTQVTVEKGERFRIENTEGTVIFDSRSVNTNPPT